MADLSAVPPKKLVKSWWLQNSLLIPALVGFCSGGGAGLLTWSVAYRTEERERIAAKIEASPVIRMHVERGDGLMPTGIVANEGPVAASALIVSVEQFFVERGTFKVRGPSWQRQNRRPWLFATNRLEGGGTVEVGFGTGEIPDTYSVYRMSARYFPEFNLTRQQSLTTNFLVQDTVFIPESTARRYITNSAAIFDAVATFRSTNGLQR